MKVEERREAKLLDYHEEEYAPEIKEKHRKALSVA